MPGGCARHLLQALADTMQADMIAGFTLAAARTGVPLIDLRDRLCPQVTCTRVSDGRPVYVDGGHISVGLSAALSGGVVEQLEAR